MKVREVIETGGLEEFLGAMDPNVVWHGVEEGQLCRNRDEVRATFEEWMARGMSGDPEIVAEAGDRLVVDPHADPPPPGLERIHHVFTVRGDRIVEMRDYADRESALRAVGLA